MASPELVHLWQRIEAHLVEARSQLPESESIHPAAMRLQEWLDHNELGLAAEELALLGDEYGCRANFWRPLLSAAELMALAKLDAAIRERLAELPST